MCPHATAATCTTTTLFESGWKMSVLGGTTLPASSQCLHCVRLNGMAFLEHLMLACWSRDPRADSMLVHGKHCTLLLRQNFNFPVILKKTKTIYASHSFI